MRTVLIALVALAFATPAVAAEPAVAIAKLKTATGKGRGKAELRTLADGVGVTISASKLARSATMGLHIHSVGKCEGPKFDSAGSHWNPTAHKHGRDNPQGAHHGDLPNLVSDARGRATLQFVIPGTSVADVLDADGAAIVLHEKADDYRTDPSGNSGPRIACGVFSAKAR